MPLQDVSNILRPGGRFKILGVLKTFMEPYSCNLEILGVLKATFIPFPRIIGGAIAPPVPPALILAQPVKIDLNKKLNPKQKTIQAFNIDA